MTGLEKFVDALKQNVSGKTKPPGVVQGIALNVKENSCDVQLISNDLVLTDVLFSATDKEEGGFILIPKEKTSVLVGTIGDDENSLYLVSMDEIESVQIVIDKETFTMDKDGFRAILTTGKFTVKNQASDAKEILLDILSAVQNLTVSTPNGPSGTPLPPTILALQQLEIKINNLFD